jgi:uncharacterized protein YlaI
MDRSDFLSIADWIKISIKFSGLCLHCKKRINSGEYGYWSRASKSVLHDQCYNSLYSNNLEQSASTVTGVENNPTSPSPSPSPITQRVGDKSLKNDKDPRLNNFFSPSVPQATPGHQSSQSSKRATRGHDASSTTNQKKTRCFICENYVDLDEGTLPYSLLKMSNRQLDASADTFFCSACLNDAKEELFEKYKTSFNKMLNKKA